MKQRATQRSPAARALALMPLAMASYMSVTVRAAEPPIPPGVDPGGIAVALLGDGIDYTRAEIAARLARDGEGEPIARDFADRDAQPYAGDGRSTAHAIVLLKASPQIRLIVVKERRDDPIAIGRMTAFAAHTPARIVYCPDAMQRQDWPVFKQAVANFKDRLFVIVQHGPKQPQLAGIANLIVAENALAPAQDSHAAKIVAKAAELLTKMPELTVADLKMGLQAEIRSAP